MTVTTTTTTVSSPYESIRTISAEALLQELRSDVHLTILDVRDRPLVRETGTIGQARSVPLYQLTARIEELADLRFTQLVVVSQTACSARTAALALEQAGFGEVFVLDRGLQAWLELGYPVEARHESSPPSSRQ